MHTAFMVSHMSNPIALQGAAPAQRSIPEQNSGAEQNGGALPFESRTQSGVVRMVQQSKSINCGLGPIHGTTEYYLKVGTFSSFSVHQI